MENKKLNSELVVLAKGVPSAEVSIVTREQFDEGMVVMKTVKVKMAELKAKKDTVLGPLNQSIKALRELFKPYESKLEAVDAAYRLAMNEFATREENERQRKLAAIEADTRLKNPETIQKKLNELGQVAPSTQKRYVLNVLDESVVPRKYLVLDESLILKDLKAGIRIKGVELVQERSIRV